ncbi:MAG: AMIN domain-containing protein, partial [Gemmatimonadaceae bacterium]|nr:AMIN domain-containing protein [Gemmatimonadaceae bacterium]
MMGPTTVAVTAAAFAHAALGSAILGGTDSRAVTPAGPTTPSAVVASTLADGPGVTGRVSRVAVGPATGGAEITIALDSNVTIKHFTLDNPSRLVIDLGGASLAMRAAYDGQARGPIRNVRLSQFRPDTVRLVIDLDGSRPYTVSRAGAQVTVKVDGPAVEVARWETKSSTFTPATQTAAGRLESPTPVAIPASAAPKDPAPVTTMSESPLVAVPSLAEQTRSQKTENDALRAEIAQLNATARDVASQTARNEAKAIADAPMENRAGPAARRTAPQAQKPRITVSYDGIDIRDVIAAFATFSGRTIVIGKEVSGLVTADINDKPWDVALQAILQAQGLAATEDASGIITVDSYKNLASNQALEPMVTQIVNVNYAKATTLKGTVQALLARDCSGLSTMATGRDLGVPMNQQQNGASGGGNGMSGQGCVVRGSVAADSATNKLIITETPSRLPEIVARLQELDIRNPQVAIKAKIIFV